MHVSEARKILKLKNKLDTLEPFCVKSVIGFDGFVDEIVHVVDKRIDAENFIRIDSMARYGERIIKSAGLSTNIEMVTVKQKLGGNGPIFANALIEFGMDITYIGALGLGSVHPVFHQMISRCQAIALSEPAQTDAIEFFDGKIISSKLESFKAVNWQSILDHVGLDAFIQIMDESDLVGFENWTMLVNMNDIWQKILVNVLPKLKKRERKPFMFFDLADPEKREVKDIREALRLINQFASYYQVILGLNKKEACEIAGILGLNIGQCNYEEQDLQTLAQFIYSRMHVSAIVIHPVKEACVVTREGFVSVAGPYCAKPKLTTGAGDNFNAGFNFAAVMGFSMEEALYMGTAVSGYYVRHAQSPDLAGISRFLDDWANGGLE